MSQYHFSMSVFGVCCQFHVSQTLIMIIIATFLDFVLDNSSSLSICRISLRWFCLFTFIYLFLSKWYYIPLCISTADEYDYWWSHCCIKIKWLARPQKHLSEGLSEGGEEDFCFIDDTYHLHLLSMPLLVNLNSNKCVENNNHQNCAISWLEFIWFNFQEKQDLVGLHALWWKWGWSRDCSGWLIQGLEVSTV